MTGSRLCRRTLSKTLSSGFARYFLALVLASLFLIGCKRHSPQVKSQPSSTPQQSPIAGSNRAVTNLSSCLLEFERDQDAAVEKFLTLDLTQGKLFSQNAPLSCSEADFSKLDRAAADQLMKQATADLGLLKRLAREIKNRRDEARMSGKSELADRYNVKLLQMASRLQGPENLKLTQLVGAGISKMAAK